jgi:hypothetical protein
MSDSQLRHHAFRQQPRRVAARTLALALAAFAVVLVSAGLAAAPALANPPCVKFAAEPAKGGSDANAGDEAHPYATLGKLVASLGAGQTGCIFSGQTIDAQAPQSLKHDSSGTESAPITITSTNPSEPATVTSSLAVEEGADWIDFTHLRFWWAQPPPRTCWNAEGNATGKACNGEPENPEDHVQIAISASHTAWLYDDIQNFNTDICMNIVSYGGATAHETLIEHSRVHNCGEPFVGQKHVNEEGAWHDHGIYDYGIGTKILNNYIYSNSRNGILFYGGGHGGVAEHNVIDENGNGITFGSTVDSTARWNIITNNSLDDTGDCAPAGCDDFGAAENEAAGDRFEDNCLDGNLSGEIEYFRSEPASLLGVIVAGNLLQTDPLYADAAAHDYTLSPSSPCLGYGPDTAQPQPQPPPKGGPPVNVQPPSVLVASLSGAPTVGLPVTALTGTWSEAPTSYGYQWSACSGSTCSPIPGATGPMYTPTAANVEETLTVTVTATNASGSASVTSAPTAPVVGLVPAVIGRPSGALSAGEAIFADRGLLGSLFLTATGAGQPGWQSTMLDLGGVSSTSAPSAAVDAARNTWIAFQGPGQSLDVTLLPADRSTAAIAYSGPTGTTYSQPAATVDQAGNLWVVAEGPGHSLAVTERAASTGTWTSDAEGQTVYSPPSIAIDPNGNLRIAFEGPNHSLWVVLESAGGAGAWSGYWNGYEGPPDTTYSAPSLAIDAQGNLWAAAQGANGALVITERTAGSGSWSSAVVTGAETVFSSPSIVTDATGNAWIAFVGPEESLWEVVDRGDGSGASVVREGPPATAYSAPSQVVGPAGELWIGYQQIDNQLGVLERLPSGAWTTEAG